MVPIVLRIVHNRRSTEVSMKKYIDPAHWDEQKLQVNSRHFNPTPVNVYLRGEVRAFQTIIDTKLAKGEEFSIEEIIALRKGKPQRDEGHHITVTDFISEFIESNPENLGVNTLQNYRSTLARFREYQPHLKLRDLSEQHLVGFEKYLREKCGCRINTIHCRLKVLRKISRMALRKKLIQNYPFQDFQLKKEHTQREYLNKDEVSQFAGIDTSTRLERLVRDSFIFCCYTGLRFSDICTIERSSILEQRGQYRLHFRMQKTQEPISMLLPVAAVNIFLDWGNENALPNDPVLPILEGYDIRTIKDLKRAISSRNAYFNRVIKELARKAGITKTVTFHVARHSFATIGLTLGIRMDVMSKLLGHSDLKTTQIYGKIVDELKDEAMLLFNK